MLHDYFNYYIIIGFLLPLVCVGGLLVVANWIAETGISEKANWVCHEFLTGTTIAIAVILLILLVSPKNSGNKVFGIGRRCPVCDHRLIGKGNYCSECGSKAF